MVDFTDNDSDFAQAELVPPNRPSGVTIIAVLAIIMGALYLLNSLTGVPALVIQVVAPDTFNFQVESEDPTVQFQLEVQKRTGEINRRYLVPLLFTSLLAFILGVALIYLAIQILRRDRPQDYRLLQNLSFAAIFYVVVVGIFYAWIQWQSWTAFVGAVETRRPSGESAMFEQMMTFSLLGGMAIAGVYQLLQLVYFVVAHRVLKRHVARIHEASSASA